MLDALSTLNITPDDLMIMEPAAIDTYVNKQYIQLNDSITEARNLQVNKKHELQKPTAQELEAILECIQELETQSKQIQAAKQMVLEALESHTLQSKLRSEQAIKAAASLVKKAKTQAQRTWSAFTGRASSFFSSQEKPGDGSDMMADTDTKVVKDTPRLPPAPAFEIGDVDSEDIGDVDSEDEDLLALTTKSAKSLEQ